MVTLAHVEIAPHGGSLAVLVRLGSLLPLALVGLWWAASRHRSRARSLANGAAIALGAAGAIHLALVPEHARESVVAAAFFFSAGLAQLVLGVLVAAGRGGRVVLVILLAVTAGLLGVYAASRSMALPGGLERESVDALGLLTKLLEVIGAGLAVVAVTGLRPRLPADGLTGLAALTLGTATLARPLFDLGPSLGQVATALGGALAASVLVGGASRSAAMRAVIDASTSSLLIRAGGLAPFVLAGIGVVLVRRATRSLPVPLIAPVAVTALAVLWLPGPAARFEILHIAHAGEPWMALAGFVMAGGLALAAASTEGLPPVVAFLGADLGGQALRFISGRTSLEAIEVPGTSLGLLLVAVVVLADPALTSGRRRWAVASALLAGALDALFRDQGVAYPAVAALAVAVALMGALRWLFSSEREPLPAGSAGDAQRPSAEPTVTAPPAGS